MHSKRQFLKNKEEIRLKAILEGLYAKYNHRECIKPDPLQFVYRYRERNDMEIAGFLAASLAFGRVEQIGKSVEKLLRMMGNSPYKFVLNFDEKKKGKLSGFKHRFVTGGDISELLYVFRKILRGYGSIESFFAAGDNSSEKDILPALSRFSDAILEMHRKEFGDKESRGMKYLICSPEGKSACKRLNLFLRWMVRDDEVDTGIWKSIDKRRLIVPVDVHMGRLCGFVGLHNKATVGIKMAEEITESFKAIEPEDPVKYDFSLSRIGIVEECSGKRRKECEICNLRQICRIFSDGKR